MYSITVECRRPRVGRTGCNDDVTSPKSKSCKRLAPILIKDTKKSRGKTRKAMAGKRSRAKI